MCGLNIKKYISEHKKVWEGGGKEGSWKRDEEEEGGGAGEGKGRGRGRGGGGGGGGEEESVQCVKANKHPT